MSIFERIFGKRASDEGQSEPPQQAVLVHLDGTDLADNVNEEWSANILVATSGRCARGTVVLTLFERFA